MWLGTEAFFSKAEIELFPTTRCPEETWIHCPPTGEAGTQVGDGDFAAGLESASQCTLCATAVPAGK